MAPELPAMTGSMGKAGRMAADLAAMTGSAVMADLALARARLARAARRRGPAAPHPTGAELTGTGLSGADMTAAASARITGADLAAVQDRGAEAGQGTAVDPIRVRIGTMPAARPARRTGRLGSVTATDAS
jgi:hypothetical protein